MATRNDSHSPRPNSLATMAGGTTTGSSPRPVTRSNDPTASTQPLKFRASMGVATTSPHLAHAGSEATRWGPAHTTNHSNLAAANHAGPGSRGPSGVSPARASTGGTGLVNHHNFANPAMNQSQGVFHSAETEAIDRWFEDLQHYEQTLEEMAAASLDQNFKEELSAIEQWFKVLSEAERTTALYSLLQSSTQMQMRFFVTVLQQMARSDPTQAALLSPVVNANSLSLEAQMEQKMSTLGLKSPSSPMIRQFARSSLGPNPTNPNTIANQEFLSPNPEDSSSSSMTTAGSTQHRGTKLSSSTRTSAPANLLLSSSNATGGVGLGMGEGLRSPLWSKEETVRERSPSPAQTGQGTSRPKSTEGLNASSNNNNNFLRSPAIGTGGLDGSLNSSSFDNQLSPLVGGSWASMVNTPLVPMFGKNGETMEPGNFGSSVSPNPNLNTNTNLDSSLIGHKLGSWQQQQQQQTEAGGIVLDDVRKFRRSARVSGGALSGMYPGESMNNNNHNNETKSIHTAQKRVQDQLQAVQQLKNLQQSAMSLGLASLPSPSLNNNASANGQQGSGGSRVGSNGALNSPGLQQTAMQAQQNWRNNQSAAAAASSTGLGANQYSSSSSSSAAAALHNNQLLQLQQQQNQYGGGGAGGDQFANIGLGTNLTLPSGLASPSATSAAASNQQQQAQQQLASLIALQQQMMQQQQQLQTLAGLSPNLGAGMSSMGLGGLGMMGTGANLSPNMAALAGQMNGHLHHHHPQISPRLGGTHHTGGHQNNYGLGMGVLGGMPSPRRSPRPHDGRSPQSFPMSSHRSGNSSTASQLPSGSGSNPDEPLDFALLGDTPSWLRSLRLHKYTSNFEGIGWKEMVRMSDADLEKRGVSALGARRKLVKVFETVRSKTGIAEDPTSSTAPAMDPTSSTDSTSPKEDTVDQDSSKDAKAEEEKRSGLEPSSEDYETASDNAKN
ncbi:Vts1p [Sporobolomyces koalae]|uniref:Vts1p n=1 Tax=Sporobolomyces koalae TaxID=500713 RepID=UPI0031776712